MIRTIVFTEQFYYPDGWGGAQLPRDLTVHLARAGMRVDVVCGSDQYAPLEDGEHQEDPRKAGVLIRRTPRLIGGSIHRHKLLKQLLFYVCSVPLLCFRRSPDLFVTQTNPPLLVPLVALAALVHRRPFVIIAQDVYPEVMFAYGMSRPSALSGRLLSRLFAWAYRRAARVVALGEVMKQRLMTKGVRAERIEVISNWATGDESIERGARNELRAKWDLVGKFVILYSGNVGIAHDLETPIAALRILLAHSPDVRLVVVGKGSRLDETQRQAERAGLAHAVQFRPLVPASLLPQSLGLAHLALVTLREGFEGLVVPSKLLGYMARAVPTAYVGPASDIELLLGASGGGVCVRNGDAEGLAGAVRSLIDRCSELESMGAASARYYYEHLSRSKGLERYATLFDDVMNESSKR